MLTHADPQAGQTLFALAQIVIFVNNADIIRRVDALDFTLGDWDDVMNVNLKPLFFTSQAFAATESRQGLAR